MKKAFTAAYYLGGVLHLCGLPAGTGRSTPLPTRADVQYFMRRLIGAEFGKGRTGEERARRNAFAESRRGVRGPCRRQHRRVAFPRQHVGGTRPLRPCPRFGGHRATLTEAFSRLGGWTPATYADGRTTDYTLRLTLRIPVEKYLREQDPDPLLFLGEDPGEGVSQSGCGSASATTNVSHGSAVSCA